MIYGVDIGGSKIELVVFDDGLEPVARERIATPTDDYSAFTAIVTDLLRKADATYGSDAPIGIGMPGLVDENGLAFCANVPCAIGKAVADDLSALIGRRVIMENDCRLFALSEATGGAGSNYRNVFGAILGTGAAAGIVIDGTLQRGSRGVAGEYGHLPVSASLQHDHGLAIRTCACGLRGCAEAYVGGPGLLAMARQFGVAAESTMAVAELWRAGDADAKRTYAAFVDILGESLANVAKLIDPDIIVMGGGLSQLPEVIADLPGAIVKKMFNGFRSPPVVVARFGDSSGVRGAAILAREARGA